MNNLKDGSLSKKNIIIYQLPLISRIMTLLSALGLTLIPILGICILKEIPLGVFFTLIAMLFYCVWAFFLCFKTYIKLDIKNKQLIIREFPGFKKNLINISDVIEIRFIDSIYKAFIIEIICVDNLREIKSWSMGPSGRIVMFNSYNIQKRRLIKFIHEANEIIKELKSSNNKNL